MRALRVLRRRALLLPQPVPRGRVQERLHGPRGRLTPDLAPQRLRWHGLLVQRVRLHLLRGLGLRTGMRLRTLLHSCLGSAGWPYQKFLLNKQGGNHLMDLRRKQLLTISHRW